MTVSLAPEPSLTISAEAVCLHGSDAVAALDAEWQAACDRTEGATVFQTAHWLRAWCDAVATREQAVPILIRVPTDGPLRLGIAIQRCEEAGTVRLRPLSSPWADYHDAVGDGDQEDLDTAARALSQIAERLDAIIELNDIRSGSLLEAVCARLGGAWAPSTAVSRLDLLNRAHLSTVTGRAEHRNKRRRLERQGPLELVRNRNIDDVLAAFPRFVALHERQWNHRSDVVASFSEPGITESFAAIASALCPHGMLDLTELRQSGRTLAAYFGFVYGDIYYAYRTAFDARYLRFSPGHLMLQSLLQDCATKGITVFDLMRGDYAYKAAYASVTGHNLRWRNVADAR